MVKIATFFKKSGIFTTFNTFLPIFSENSQKSGKSGIFTTFTTFHVPWEFWKKWGVSPSPKVRSSLRFISFFLLPCFFFLCFLSTISLFSFFFLFGWFLFLTFLVSFFYVLLPHLLTKTTVQTNIRDDVFPCFFPVSIAFYYLLSFVFLYCLTFVSSLFVFHVFYCFSPFLFLFFRFFSYRDDLFLTIKNKSPKIVWKSETIYFKFILWISHQLKSRYLYTSQYLIFSRS